METKKCSKCNVEKPGAEFFKSGVYPSGKPKYRGDCKDCAKKDTANWRVKNRSEYNNYAAAWRAKNPGKQHATDIKRNYGLHVDKYNEMLVAQDYGCKICRKRHNPDVLKGRLFVDHDHATGKVRGLLCVNCNTALGHTDDRIDILEKAIAYLKEHSNT